MDIAQLKEKVAVDFSNLLNCQEIEPYAVNNTQFVLEEVCNLIGVSGANSEFLLALDGISQVVTTGVVYHYFLNTPGDEQATDRYMDLYYRLVDSLALQIEDAVETMAFCDCDCDECEICGEEDCEFCDDCQLFEDTDECECDVCYTADKILVFLEALEDPRIVDKFTEIADQIAASFPQV